MSGYSIGEFVSGSVRSSFDISRGLLGLALGAIGGAVAPFALAISLSTYHYVSSRPARFDLVTVLHDLSIFPFIGCAAVCAGGGFATLAPSGSYRFMRSLLLVAVASVAIWFAIGGALQVWEAISGVRYSPWRLRGDADILIYPSELAVFGVPPLVVSAAITAFRVRRSRPIREEIRP